MAIDAIRKAAQTHLYNKMDEAGKALKAFPRGPTGLTTDAVKKSEEYRAAKSNYDKAFATVRQFNSSKPTMRSKDLGKQDGTVDELNTGKQEGNVYAHDKPDYK